MQVIPDDDHNSEKATKQCTVNNVIAGTLWNVKSVEKYLTQRDSQRHSYYVVRKYFNVFMHIFMSDNTGKKITNNAQYLTRL